MSLGLRCLEAVKLFALLLLFLQLVLGKNLRYVRLDGGPHVLEEVLEPSVKLLLRSVFLVLPRRVFSCIAVRIFSRLE